MYSLCMQIEPLFAFQALPPLSTSSHPPSLSVNSPPPPPSSVCLILTAPLSFHLFPLSALSLSLSIFSSFCLPPSLSLSPPSLPSSLSAVSQGFWSHWKSFQDQGMYIPTPVSLEHTSVYMNHSTTTTVLRTCGTIIHMLQSLYWLHLFPSFSLGRASRRG